MNTPYLLLNITPENSKMQVVIKLERLIDSTFRQQTLKKKCIAANLFFRIKSSKRVFFKKKQPHYFSGCLRSNKPVPPLTTFPTTRQAEGDRSSSWDPNIVASFKNL
uniref:Uncharacterized protein n=1 Tax=Micrurus paraensis TaxID=1970185 RepID=A0A2D4KAH1_9SAUR